MAISKIFYMNEGSKNFYGKHLKRSIDYIINPEKTQGGRLVGAINCQTVSAYEEMKRTKQKFGKMDKRQGYHIILSFKENEVEPDIAFEITQKFVEEYLGSKYEAVYAVHDNTDHVHAHIVFNSVSFLDGKKYRYEKGDWAKYIQPVTNKLCEEYGLSIIAAEEKNNGRRHDSYMEWEEQQKNRFIWSNMIKRDIDACILQTNTFEEFLGLMQEKGYEIKRGKYLSVKLLGMDGFKRCKTLGTEYAEERIKERIPREDLAYYQSLQKEEMPKLVFCRVKRYRRAKMSGLQKKYYAKLYRTGQLKKKPYSHVWRYRDDIRKMKKLQEEYLFLVEHDIHSAEELTGVIASLTDKKKEAAADKSQAYRAKARCRGLFLKADKMEELKPAEDSYRNGDTFFYEEHKQWVLLKKELLLENYTYEEVEELKKVYTRRCADACAKERAVLKKLRIGESIFKELYSDEESREFEQEKNKEKTVQKDKKDKPQR